MKALINLLAVFFLLIAVSACDSSPSGDDGNLDLNVVTVTDLAADPFVGMVGGQPVGSNRFTFFSLRNNAVVAATDSATTKWDIALKGTTILINGGTSGPGQGRAQVIEGLFEEIVTAPETGWKVDGTAGPAITPGSGNGWYNYNPAAMTISPIPGRVLLVSTADGKYAKLRILSYYKGSPATPTMDSEARYFTFEFVLQTNGSRDLG